MNLDPLWHIIRGGLMFGGGVLAYRGWIAEASVGPLVDQIMGVGGALGGLGMAIWSFYVTWKTVMVPATVAKSLDLPVISPVTGAIKKP